MVGTSTSSCGLTVERPGWDSYHRDLYHPRGRCLHSLGGGTVAEHHDRSRVVAAAPAGRTSGDARAATEEGNDVRLHHTSARGSAPAPRLPAGARGPCRVPDP